MAKLKSKLVEKLRIIEGVEHLPSPVSGGSALFYNGKPFAHFHNDNELDLRLTTKVIKELGLLHPSGSFHHPNRSSNSAWIELRFSSVGDVDSISKLVRLAVEQL